MSIDGALLRYVKNEIEEKATGLRVEKVYQPGKHEIILCLRGMKESFKLLISASSSSARVHFTTYDIPNPQNPPMLCMLLRKKLHMAKLIAVRQQGLERALYLDFAAKNELGDDTLITVAVEIMGKYSNIILLENGIVVDAVKRVNSEMSSKRVILPRLKYEMPPNQDKMCIFNATESSLDDIFYGEENAEAYKIINSKIQGISTILSKRLLNFLFNDENIKINALDQQGILMLKNELLALFSKIKNNVGTPLEIIYKNKVEASFVSFEGESLKRYDNFSDLIDKIYFKQDRDERIHSRTSNIVKHLRTIISRLENKVKEQKKELLASDKKDTYKLYGDLIMANLYKIKSGEKKVNLLNYYDENGGEVEVSLDPLLSSVQNSQAYYKKYKKACTAEKILKEQIEKSSMDIKYLDGVMDFLSRAETEQELYEICTELEENKYIKKNKSKNKIKMKPLKPLEYISKDGFKILVGRNSKQNDKLTMQIAGKNDIWFHVKDMQGAHVIIVTNGKEASDEAINLAANLSALHSKASESSKVAVDYTKVKNVKKPIGAKPGMVNYFNYSTIYVTPTKNMK